MTTDVAHQSGLVENAFGAFYATDATQGWGSSVTTRKPSEKQPNI